MLDPEHQYDWLLLIHLLGTDLSREILAQS